MTENREQKIDLILEKIEKLEEKLEENNEFLNTEKRNKRIGFILWIIKWVVIISLGIVSWAHLQPIYKNLMEVYENISTTVKKTENSLSELRKTLDKIPKADDFSLENIKSKFTK